MPTTTIDRTRARGTLLEVEAATAQLRTTFDAAEARLRTELEDLTERLLFDPRLAAASARREQVRGLLAEVADLRADLDGQSRLFVRGSLARVYTAGMARANVAVGLDPGAGSFSTVHRRALEVMALDAFDDLAAATSFVEQRTKLAIREAARLSTQVGALTGSSVPTDVRDLLGRFARSGVTGFVDAAGREWRLGTYAAMVGRTKSASAYNTGTVIRASETGTDVFEVRDGVPSGHEECVRYNGRTATSAWALGNPIEHPNCVRSFGPLPLHDGPVDLGGDRDRVDLGSTLTDDQRAALGDLVDRDLDRDDPDLDGLLRRLPQGRTFPVPAGVLIHGHRLGRATGLYSRGRLYLVDDTVIPAGQTASAFLRQVRRETLSAIPGGMGPTPLRSVVYARGANVAAEARFGFGIGGLAGRRGVSMYHTERLGLQLGTLRHEVGHSLVHATNRRALDAAESYAQRVTAARLAVVDDAPDWLTEAFGGREAMLEAVRSGRDPWWLTSSGPDLVRIAGRDARQLRANAIANAGGSFSDAIATVNADLRRDATAFVRARNRRLRTVEADVVRYRAVSGIDVDDVLAYPRSYSSTSTFSTTARPGDRYVTAATADADRLERLRELRLSDGDRDGWELGRSLRSAVFDDALEVDGAPSIAGWHTYDRGPSGGVRRPGVTPYAASVGDGVEDWAEAWRLYVHDQREGGLGTWRPPRARFEATPDRQRVRFADLYPERAAYFDLWASELGLDLSTLRVTVTRGPTR